MTPFLKQIAQEINTLSIGDLQQSLVIVPNRRAKLYILKYLSENIEKPLWTPEIISINDFIYQKIEMQEAEQIDMLINMYEAHKIIEKGNIQSLDQFSSWADLLLSDFNDIDLYMVPVKKLFSYLSDVKKLENWHLDPAKLTEQEKNYIRFYEKLGRYYSEFTKIIIDKNIAYQGLAYRIMAENIDNINIDYKHIYIAGFNALSSSEELIIKHLEHKYSAKTYWDIDNYYYGNKTHEAGKFLRHNLRNTDSNKIRIIENNWLNNNKNINIYGVNGDVAQIKFTAQLLQEQIINNNTSINNTALVLADENLLIPMINSIPEEVEAFNPTMSYPLRLHSGFELINSIIGIYSEHDFENKQEKPFSIYYKKMESLLLHPFVQAYLNTENNAQISKLFKEVHEKNIQRIDLEFLETYTSKSPNLQSIIDILQHTDDKIISVLNIVLEIFNLINSEAKNKWESSFLNHYIEVIGKLHENLQSIDEIEQLSTLSRWTKNAINHSPIPFIGESLNGLQIMGMLETRTLDFENIILLSVNEGILPKTKPYQSFILFDIKREFNMPLPNENDAIMSYHFYRLLQRAKNVSLIYNSSKNDMNSGEISRFIKQIELEIPSANPQINIHHKQIEFSLAASEKTKEIIIEKTDEIMDKIVHWLKNKSLSPSSLNNYKRCTYFFYLQKILGIKSNDEVEELMASNTQGTLIHGSLEDYYNLYKGNTINYDEFIKTSHKIMDFFNHRIDTEYKTINTKTGKNYLSRKIMEQYIKNFIKSEKEFLKQNNKIDIIGVEENLSSSFIIKTGNNDIEIKFNGSADRIDRQGNTIRLIDYKTGKVESSELNISANKDGRNDKWELMFSDKRNKAFQLMMYAWMYWDKKPKNNTLETSISAIKNHSANMPLYLYKESNITQEHISRFEEDLKLLISELLDTETPFSQRKNDNKCEYCDYREICGR